MIQMEFLITRLKEIGIKIKVLSDSGWGKGVTGGRCISNFTRTITFSKELNEEEIITISKILEDDDKCPGWTGVSSFEKGNNSYGFSTTWDSSD